MSAPAGDLAGRVLGGDRRAAARLLRRVDDRDPRARAEVAELYRRSPRRPILGVTGSPGVGKSSLVDRLISNHRRAGLTVGVVAVDPSSPLSGGAVLGDRVRMMGHALDPGVFIRSLATRGKLGGLSRSAAESVAVFEGLGLDRVLVETVGVGQSEVDVSRLAETTLVVVAPGAGDHVQAMKAGLMEIADVYAVNKADREGADQAARELEQMLHLLPRPPGSWSPPVVKVSALDGRGLPELTAALEGHRAHLSARGELGRRWEARARFELEEAILEQLRGEAEDDRRAAALAAAIDRIVARSSDPTAEAAALLGA